MKVTAETITDEQIRALRDELLTEAESLSGGEWVAVHELRHSGAVALGLRRSPGRGGKRRARERCAAAWNARQDGVAAWDAADHDAAKASGHPLRCDCTTCCIVRCEAARSRIVYGR